MAQLDAYQSLIQRLDQFIRKYYLNQIIRGTLYTLGLVGILFLTISLLEGNFYFDQTGRKTLFFSFLAISVLAFSYWVLLPVAHYMRLGKVISHDHAARVIGDHFPTVQDKLLNLLQLGRQAELGASDELLLAGIEQKSVELRPVSFKKAIDLQENRKYLRYALPPLLILIGLLIAAPSLITEPTTRLVQNNQDFERPAPFHFVVADVDPSVIQYENYLLEVEAVGEISPAEAFIELDGSSYQLRPVGEGRFTYEFERVADDVRFSLRSADVESKHYTLNVIEKPSLTGFSIQVEYPSYTGLKNETISNLGDLTVPEGSQLRWLFDASNTDELELRFGNEVDTATRDGSDFFTYQRRFRSSTPYSVISGNADLPRADSAMYALSVIKDKYPQIQVETFRDSSQRDVLFYAGSVTDDYGISRVEFVSTRSNDSSPERIDLTNGAIGNKKAKDFDYTLDLSQFELAPGEELRYYFEVFDNDGVNGAKSTKSNIEVFRKKTIEEFEESRAQQSENIRQSLEESIEESKKIQEEVRQIRAELLQKKELDWQTQKRLEELAKRQQELQKKIEDAKQEVAEKRKDEAEFAKPDEETQEKEEQLDEMLEQLDDPELQELMEMIQELNDQLDKDTALDIMQQAESKNEQLENKLERYRELLKKLEVEVQMQEAIEKLEDLSEKQNELAEESLSKEDGEQNDEQQAEQEELTKEFEKLTEKLEDLEKKNDDLKKPMDTGTDKSEQESIKEDQQKAGEQMQQQQNQKAGQKQMQAAKKMKAMSGAMQQAMQGSQQQQAQEDIAALRQLLENLVAISYDQEMLMASFGKTEVNTPRYVEDVQRQFKLKDDFKIVEDSLTALANRVTQIESFVLDKVTDINFQMEKGLAELENRKTAQASNRQQRIMTDVNDLALMLSESMEQMQQQMAQSMPGNQSCEKPGGQGKGEGSQGDSGSKPSDKMSNGQQSLKQQMERALENAKKRAEGQKKGKPGAGEGGSPTSKEFAEMAAKQAELRKKLIDKQRELREKGKGSEGLQQIIDQMDKTETDLVNKRLTNETLNRQQDIISRLLEAEKAAMKQDEDDKRESEVAQTTQRTLPPELEDYLKKRNGQKDIYREVNPNLQPYYRQLVEQYLQEIKGN